MGDNLPIAEQWHKVALAHADAEAAAQILEESKTAFLAEGISSLIRDNPKMSIARAETEVKGGAEWLSYIHGMVKARKYANRLRVEKEYLRMKFSTWLSEDANHRQGVRMT